MSFGLQYHILSTVATYDFPGPLIGAAIYIIAKEEIPCRQCSQTIGLDHTPQSRINTVYIQTSTDHSIDIKL